MHTSASDELLTLMRAGDLRALDHFARQYSQRLLAVARRQCHLRADAEDAVQQALLAASTSMTGIHEDGSPLAWLSTLVARQCYRLNERATSLPLPEAECSCDDPSLIAERNELSSRLGDALMTLSRTDRLAVLLSSEGFNGVEIAERFGLSHDAVRGRLKRARQQLRAALDDTVELAGRTSPHDPSTRDEITKHR